MQPPTEGLTWFGLAGTGHDPHCQYQIPNSDLVVVSEFDRKEPRPRTSRTLLEQPQRKLPRRWRTSVSRPAASRPCMRRWMESRTWMLQSMTCGIFFGSWERTQKKVRGHLIPNGFLMFLEFSWLLVCPESWAGADLDVVPRPLGTRTIIRSENRKWHNVLMEQVARMDQDNKLPALRQSRQQGWIQHQAAVRKKLAPTLPACLEMDRGNVHCVKWGSSWTVAMAISVWRHYQAGTGGAQLVANSLPNGSLHSVRVVRA